MWTDAKTAAEALLPSGFQLASISSLSENNFIQSLIQANDITVGSWWLGGYGSYQNSGHTEQPSSMRLWEVYHHEKTY